MKEKIKKITVDSSGTIRTVLQAIDRGAIGVALLAEPGSGKFVGLVTDGDVRRALLKGLGLESSADRIEHPETITATVDMNLNEISAMFSEPIRVVPVLNNERIVVDLALFGTRGYFPVAAPKFGDAELRYVSECVLTGWVSSVGKFVRRFESQFSEFCGTKFAITTSSGTAALHLSLVALGIGPGDEVIVPSLTFISTANAVVFTGATPVFLDSEFETWNMDTTTIEAAVSNKTKAIIPVHLYGHPANMDPVLIMAKKHNLAVIEDAAEAHGALYRGEMVGSLGDLGVFSFYGNKTITTGEGGMIVTDNEDLAEKLRILRDHGMDPERRYWHTVLGYNYRMTNIQAALGVGQMERIDQIIEQKRRNAAFYNKGLQDIQGITTPPELAWAKNIYWLYSILVNKDEFGISSQELGLELKRKGIDTRPLFLPVHQQPIYNTGQRLPVCEQLSLCGLSLPSFADLNRDEIRRVVKEVTNIQEHARC
jgi:perosamine synthetase